MLTGSCAQVAVFVRSAEAVVEAQGGGVCADTVFDSRNLPALDLAAGTEGLRKAMETHAAAGGLAEDVDAMLDGLQAFDLEDDDVND